jgi:ABC-type multidrug transport system fused ATPase/permease subunit
LKSLNAKFELGKTTAIVGPSGAGKSSIALMIERFYEPSGGEVLIDGKPLKSLNLKHYRN